MLRSWAESVASLTSALLRHWLGFVPAGVLGALNLAGVAVPIEWIWLVLGAGAAWALLASFHELRLQAAGQGYGHYLLPEAPTVVVVHRDPANLLMLRPEITLRNHSARPLRYDVEALSAIVGEMTVAEPKLPNHGGIVGPNDLAVLPFDVISPVRGEHLIGGVIDYTITYGPPDDSKRFRSHRRFKIEMRRHRRDYETAATVTSQADAWVQRAPWMTRIPILRSMAR